MPKLEAVSGVYLVEDHTDGSTYVGSTRNLRHRWNCLNSGGKLLRVSAHIRNHPDHVISMRLLEEVSDPAHLKRREQWFIDRLQPTLNVSEKSTCDYPKHGRGIRGDGNWHATPVTGVRISDGAVFAFPSLISAANKTGTLKQNISRVLCGRAKTANGYKWAYSNN